MLRNRFHVLLGAVVMAVVLVPGSPAEAAVPINDAFADAIDVNELESSERDAVTEAIVTSGTNVDATTEAGEPNEISTAFEGSVWWSWKAPSSIGSVEVSTDGSSFDTIVEVYEGTDLASLAFVAGDDDGGTGLTSLVTFFPVAGRTYHVRVGGFDDAGDIVFELAWTRSELAGSDSGEPRSKEFGSSPFGLADGANVALFASQDFGGLRDMTTHLTTPTPGRPVAASPDARWVLLDDGQLRLLDRQTGEITLVSATPSGSPGSCCLSSAALTDDGRFVAFSSSDPDLLDDFDTQVPRILVRDVGAGSTTLISRRPDGQVAAGSHENVSMSADGRYVVFDAETDDVIGRTSNGARDVYLHDRTTGTTRLVSRRPDGRGGNGDSRRPQISRDGTTVTFTSSATDLVEGLDGSRGRTYTFEVASGTVRLVSGDGSGDVYVSVISDDGRFVAFGVQDQIDGHRFDTVDTWTGTVDSLTGFISSFVSPSVAISGDGRFLLVLAASSGVGDRGPVDGNRFEDAYVVDRNVPGPPSNLVADVAGDRALRLSWTAPEQVGTVPVDRVSHAIRVTGPGGVRSVDVAPGETTAVVDDLVPGAEHTFEVFAIGSGGAGPAMSVTAVPDTLPGPVSALAASARVDGIDVSWSAPAGVGSVVSFVVEVSPAEGRIVATPTATSARIDGLRSGVTYTVSVRAVGVVGTGPVASIRATTLVTVTPPPPPATRVGYWMVDAAGNIYPFGDAETFGLVDSPAGTVALQSSPDGGGLWLLTIDGIVHTRGTAAHHGNVDPTRLDPGETPAALSVRADGSGYWVFTDRGRAITFGTAAHLGDMSAVALNGPIVASVATPDGAGYYMVGSDGGVFSFGSAEFKGSTGSLVLNRPVVGIAPDPDGSGYWLVASDGGIFAFDADFAGSMGSVPLNRPVIGAIAFGDAYLLVAADGGIFNFSDQPFLGSLGSNPPPDPVTGVAAFAS